MKARLMQLMMFTAQEGIDILEAEPEDLNGKLRQAVVRGFDGVVKSLRNGDMTRCPVCDSTIDTAGNLGYGCAIFEAPDLEAESGEMIVQYAGVCGECVGDNSPAHREELKTKVMRNYDEAAIPVARSTGTMQ